MSKVLYDIETKDGKLINKCYFVETWKAIKGGFKGVVLQYAPLYIQIYQEDGTEVKGNELDSLKIVNIFVRVRNQYFPLADGVPFNRSLVREIRYED